MKTGRTLQDKAMLALQQAVKNVIKRHKQTGQLLAIWENGKVIEISADQALRRNKKRSLAVKSCKKS